VAISDDDKPVSGDRAVYLRELFVTPQLSPRYLLPEQVLQNELDEHEEAGIELVQAIQPHQRLCILGDPGTGKSTLINWLMLALSYSGENLTKITLGELVPFVLVLRDLNLEKTKNWQDVWQRFLDQEQNQKTLTACFNDDAEVLEQLFASGQALILLDGLDEITHEGQRQALANSLRQAMTEFPRCRFIVTTRVVGFNQADWFGLDEVKQKSKYFIFIKIFPNNVHELRLS
jgi:predicted NACHT family NTPase